LSDSEKFVQFISNSGNWNWNISQLIHGVRARTSSLLALHHQHSCERKKSMHNRKLVTVSSTKLFPLRILRIHIA